MDLREALYQNIHNLSENEINDTIIDAISSQKESLLPGLGYMFELAWADCSSDEKNRLINKIRNKLK